MIAWEGSILLVSLMVGGGALFYLVVQTHQQSERLKEFFATFSHDLKTSLTSLRLQAEALQEDFRDQSSPLINRLLGDTVRLQVQLENSLFLADANERKLFIEKLELVRLLEPVRNHWPEAKVEVQGNGYVFVDSRAFESVLKNLVHNSLSHGEAKSVKISINSGSNGRVEIRVADDGSGFRGDFAKLGQLFLRHAAKSGSGVGLYLVKNLVRDMGGEIEFSNAESGFVASLNMPGEMA